MKNHTIIITALWRIIMVCLKTFDFLKSIPRPNIASTAHVAINTDYSFTDIEALIKDRAFHNVSTISLFNNKHQYIDEMFLDDNARSDFEEMIFRILEQRLTKHTKLFIIFKISDNFTLRELKDNGFIEWLYYFLLFCRGTQINFSLIVEKSNCIDGNAYKVVKELNNPRLGIAYNIKKIVSNPEDIYTITNLLISDMDTEKYPYTEYKISNFKGDQL
jgi:hypothetical protein